MIKVLKIRTFSIKIICRFGYEKTPSRIFGKVIAARKFRVNTISFPKCF